MQCYIDAYIQVASICTTPETKSRPVGLCFIGEVLAFVPVHGAALHGGCREDTILPMNQYICWPITFGMK
jgi:hypothetical protein